MTRQPLRAPDQNIVRLEEYRAAKGENWNAIVVDRLKQLSVSAHHYGSTSMVGFFWTDHGRTRRVAINVTAENAVHYLAELEAMRLEIERLFVG